MSLPKEAPDLTPPMYQNSKWDNRNTRSAQEVTAQKEHGFQGVHRKEKTIDGADVHFIGIWVQRLIRRFRLRKSGLSSS